MGDSGKIDIGANFAKPKTDKAAAKNSAKSDTPTAEPVKSNASLENRTMYRSSSESQVKESKAEDNFTDNKEPVLDSEIRHKNPVLAAKLKNRRSLNFDKKKHKKKPPKPSLKVRFARKGTAINPRKVKPQIPGRLKAFLDDPTKPLEKLKQALQSSKSIADLNMQHLFDKNFEEYRSYSMSKIMEFDEYIFALDFDTMLDFLKVKAEMVEDEPFLHEFMTNIVHVLQGDPNNLYAMLQLFLPFPLPFVFSEPDREFKDDEDELEEDHKGNGFFDDEDEESDEDELVEVSMSVETLNFKRLHFLICYNKADNEMKIAAKGEMEATELAIPIESNLDDAVLNDLNNLVFYIDQWRENIRKAVETRNVKLRVKGKLDPIMIKACNSLLETIYENDLNIDDEFSSSGLGLM